MRNQALLEAKEGRGAGLYRRIVRMPGLAQDLRMEIMTREALYELVWSEPVADLARRLGISDVGLAKQCRRANIPLPTRGYWARLDAGQPVERASLPAEALTRTTVVAVGRRELPVRNHLPRTELAAIESMDVPAFPGDLEELRRHWRARLKRVTVPPLARFTHPLIAALLEREAGRQENRWSYSSSEPLTSRFETRRLRLLNALFLALDRVGGSVQVGDDRGRELSVSIRGTRVPFWFDSAAVFRRRAASVHRDPQQRAELLQALLTPCAVEGRARPAPEALPAAEDPPRVTEGPGTVCHAVGEFGGETRTGFSHCSQGSST
jgi:hypothetical protein